MKHTLLSLIILSCVGTAFPQTPAIQDVLKKIESIQTRESDARAKVVITNQKAGQGAKVTEAMYYSRDKDDAFIIVMLAPESEKGNGYLRMGDNFWMYRRNTRTFQHINRDESIAGSNAKGGDFESRKLTELYQGAVDAAGKEIIAQDKLGQIPVWKLELKAKVNDVDYPRKIMWVRKDNGLELKEEAFSGNNTLMQTSYFRKYTIVDGKYVAVEMMFIDEFEKGNKTMVELSGISSEKLDDAIFTKAYLENLSK